MAACDNINTINHEGIVLSNDGNIVIVRISSESACSGCHTERPSCFPYKKRRQLKLGEVTRLNQARL